MNPRITPVIITVGVSAAFAAALGLSPIGLSTGQPTPSVCHVPPGNPEQANAISPNHPLYAFHLNNHPGDFLITEGLTCPATVPTTVLTTVPTTVGDPVPTDPTTTTTTIAGTTPTTAGVAPVATVVVLPTGSVAQTTPTLPSSK